MLITPGTDMNRAFLEAMANAVDSRVLGNSRRYDNWNQLNPEGFLYTAENGGQAQDVSAYLAGENRAFVNVESISSSAEDRRQIFKAAMEEGNEAVFASAPMQAKLRRMCEAIREAFDMRKQKEHFPWEKYLDVPMVELEESNG